MRGHWGGVRESIDQASEALREYNQRMKEKYGRPGEGDPPGGGSPDDKGGKGGKGPQQQWVWTRAAIIEYLEQAGLDKLLSEDLAQQFVQPDGSVNYLASDAQKRWGGKNSTLAEALGKMVDYYKYGEGKFEADQRTQFLQNQGGGTSRQPAPPPTTTTTTSSSSTGQRDRGSSSGVTLQINLHPGVDLSNRAEAERMARQLMPAIDNLTRRGLRS